MERFWLRAVLNARYVRRCRALLAVNDLKGYLVADLKVVEHNTL